jgi:ABC-2 type transport system ATP-binding protein
MMIELKSVTKNYGAVRALSDVSFAVEEGEYFALLGPNGAGKTTVIRILLDFTRPDSGSAWIGGRPSTDFSVREIIGYLPENMQLPPWLSGSAFLKRQAALYGLSGRKLTSAVERSLELTGMTQQARMHSSTYSKGMLQRIGLAAALLCSPRLLILDEPTTGLDPVGIREFRNILERMKPDRVTVLLNSHILSEVEKLCTTAAILKKGTIVVKDSIDNLAGENETLEDVFVKHVGG